TQFLSTSSAREGRLSPLAEVSTGSPSTGFSGRRHDLLDTSLHLAIILAFFMRDLDAQLLAEHCTRFRNFLRVELAGERLGIDTQQGSLRTLDSLRREAGVVVQLASGVFTVKQ